MHISEDVESLYNGFLEHIPLNVMFANEEGMIVYINKNSLNTLQSIESLLPCKAHEVLGANIDIFHHNPKRIRTILDDRVQFASNIRLKTETLKLDIYPIHDNDGAFKGTMVSWLVVTDQFALANKVNSLLEVLTASSVQAEMLCQMLMSGMDDSSEKADNVNEKSNEIADLIGNTSVSLGEIRSTIQEINERVHDSSNVAKEVNSLSQDAFERVTHLNDSVLDINNIVDLIKTISDETKLLALNATIEASRAGESGKGFAVVANEIKELSNQTKQAITDIVTKVEDIQSTTNNFSESIKSLKDISETLEGSTNSIATSIEEQNIVIADVDHNTSVVAEGANEVASNITDVRNNISESKTSTETIFGSAQRLSKEAQALGGYLKEFTEKLGIN